MALIDLQNVSKHYSAQKILTEINFHVDEGERIVIIGKNGKVNELKVNISNPDFDFTELEFKKIHK